MLNLDKCNRLMNISLDVLALICSNLDYYLVPKFFALSKETYKYLTEEYNLKKVFNLNTNNHNTLNITEQIFKKHFFTRWKHKKDSQLPYRIVKNMYINDGCYQYTKIHVQSKYPLSKKFYKISLRFSVDTAYDNFIIIHLINDHVIDYHLKYCCETDKLIFSESDDKYHYLVTDLEPDYYEVNRDFVLSFIFSEEDKSIRCYFDGVEHEPCTFNAHDNEFYVAVGSSNPCQIEFIYE